MLQPSVMAVAPFTGAWIEIGGSDGSDYIGKGVAPFAGAWIEILLLHYFPINPIRSLPSRERGLKFRRRRHKALRAGRSLHGSVD